MLRINDRELKFLSRLVAKADDWPLLESVGMTMSDMVNLLTKLDNELNDRRLQRARLANYEKIRKSAKKLKKNEEMMKHVI